MRSRGMYAAPSVRSCYVTVVDFAADWLGWSDDRAGVRQSVTPRSRIRAERVLCPYRDVPSGRSRRLSRRSYARAGCSLLDASRGRMQHAKRHVTVGLPAVRLPRSTTTRREASDAADAPTSGCAWRPGAAGLCGSARLRHRFVAVQERSCVASAPSSGRRRVTYEPNFKTGGSSARRAALDLAQRLASEEADQLASWSTWPADVSKPQSDSRCRRLAKVCDLPEHVPGRSDRAAPAGSLRRATRTDVRVAWHIAHVAERVVVCNRGFWYPAGG